MTKIRNAPRSVQTSAPMTEDPFDDREGTAQFPTNLRRQIVRGLVAKRVELGKSQQEVAEAMGSTQPAIARFEAGLSDPKLSTLERYAHALDVTLSIEVAKGRGEAMVGSSSVSTLDDQLS